MTLDLIAPATALIAILKGISGLADEADGTVHVSLGVPESLATRTSAYVAAVPRETTDKATQLITVDLDYLVAFGYRVGGNQVAAETALLTYLAAFITTMSLPANRTLGGTVDSARLDFSLVNNAQFEVIAGQEFRVCPVLVRTTQRFNP